MAISLVELVFGQIDVYTATIRSMNEGVVSFLNGFILAKQLVNLD